MLFSYFNYIFNIWEWFNVNGYHLVMLSGVNTLRYMVFLRPFSNGYDPNVLFGFGQMGVYVFLETTQYLYRKFTYWVLHNIVYTSFSILCMNYTTVDVRNDDVQFYFHLIITWVLDSKGQSDECFQRWATVHCIQGWWSW